MFLSKLPAKGAPFRDRIRKRIMHPLRSIPHGIPRLLTDLLRGQIPPLQLLGSANIHHEKLRGQTLGSSVRPCSDCGGMTEYFAARAAPWQQHRNFDATHELEQ